MIYEIILPLNFNHGFDYSSDIPLINGDLVLVNFRNKENIGVVKGLGTSNLSPDKIKPVIQKLELSLDDKLCQFLNQVARYNLAPIGEVYRMAISQIEPKIFQLINDIAPINYSPTLSKLNDAQTKVFEKIINSNNDIILLEGVTGSGKTEIYFSLIERYLQQNKQVLLLMPEIALTTQIVERFIKKFHNDPVLWHSSLTPKKRLESLASIISGKAKVIIGARSSVFLPFKNLGLVMVDEEHDQSYKQDDKVCYHGRNMAILRAVNENIKIILGSATPSIETLVNAQLGKYEHIQIDTPYNNQLAKEITIIDLTKDKLPAGQYISKNLLAQIIENLHKNEQSLLFLNRRGFAPLLLCKECGFRVTCPDCSSWLVYHKNIEKLICHHCGREQKISHNCHNCSSEQSFIACGPGVERIEEEIKQKLPKARIININTDNITNVKQIEQIFKQIIDHDYDIIIGTQMISKGLDFPNLTLVGVIDGDVGLGGDLRAMERSYQIINQVSGRSGRHKPGQAIIQTYNPNNLAVQAIKNNNKHQFIQNEIEIRKNHHMPPFTRLVAIVVSSLNESILQQFVRNMLVQAPITSHIEILGPAPAIIYRLRNRYRIRMLVKANLKFNIQQYVTAWLQNISKPGSIKIKIDVDPYNFN